MNISISLILTSILYKFLLQVLQSCEPPEHPVETGQPPSLETDLEEESDGFGPATYQEHIMAV
jgi:hypothetical protein